MEEEEKESFKRTRCRGGGVGSRGGGGTEAVRWPAVRPRGSWRGPSPCDLQEAGGHPLTRHRHRKRALAQERNTIRGFFAELQPAGDAPTTRRSTQTTPARL